MFKISKLLDKALAIGADFALIVKGSNPYTRMYKKGSWVQSRNCLLYWNEFRGRWDNSCELSFVNIEYALKITGRNYSLVNFKTKERFEG